MATRFEKYRMKDGETPLAASYFNPLLQDIDLRLQQLEAQQERLDTAIAQLVALGLQRLDATITAGLAPLATQDQLAALQDELDRLRPLLAVAL
ncbi:hypothetical protein [Desulfuromonas thiophila]|uniref:hypothetical protein n=1 Tax=Desulfuromonas thiophila TaxID=57664 RepID=UPI0029F47175|nr:hypothetical protein [Desulfuromonas thiophila]